MSEDDIRYMKAAMEEAKTAFEKNEVPVGAVVVCGGQIIARAHNLTETLSDPTAHAEMQALTAATSWLGGKYLNDCTVYITLEPCPMCAGALFWCQPARVVYGAKDEKRGYTQTGANLMHPKTVVEDGAMAKESAELLRIFFKNKR